MKCTDHNGRTFSSFREMAWAHGLTATTVRQRLRRDPKLDLAQALRPKGSWTHPVTGAPARRIDLAREAGITPQALGARLDRGHCGAAVLQPKHGLGGRGRIGADPLRGVEWGRLVLDRWRRRYEAETSQASACASTPPLRDGGPRANGNGNPDTTIETSTPRAEERAA